MPHQTQERSELFLARQVEASIPSALVFLSLRFKGAGRWLATYPVAMILLGLPILLLAASTQEPAAAQWPQFRGPDGNPSVDDAKLPLSFDLEQDLLWRASLPSGASSPCIAGDRIFLTGSEGEHLIMLCIQRSTGEELWRRHKKFAPIETYAHSDVQPAVPTACTDGEQVVFYFGDWGLMAFDVEGEATWERKLEQPKRADFGIGPSPILVDGKVILNRDGCADSGIVAYGLKDGEELWRLDRPGYGFSFGTPYVWESSAGRELIVAGTQRLSGLDLATGAERWFVDRLCAVVCTSPIGTRENLYFAAWSTGGAEGQELLESLFGEGVFDAEQVANAAAAFKRLDSNGDGKVKKEELHPCRAKDAYAIADRDRNGYWTLDEYDPVHNLAKGRGKNLMVAVRPGGKGDVSKSHVRWSNRRGIPYVSSPLLHEGRLYLLKTGGLVSCFDPVTGKAHFDRERLDDRGEYYSTPLGVPGHVLLASDDGRLYVLKASDDFKIVSSFDLGDSIQATPAIVDGRLYVRTETGLLVFGD